MPASEPTSAREALGLHVGTVVASRYAVDEVLAIGGMSVVFRARDQRLGSRVALKVLRRRGDRRERRDAQRLLREARTIAGLRSDHVVRVLDVDAASEPPYLVMELLEGATVAQLLDATGRFPVDTAVRIVAQACRGVADAHAIGVMHRDLKPSNLVVTTLPDGTKRVKVIDFGISKRLFQDDEPALTASGQIVGSPRYMAPEQVRGAEADARSDVWALGAILYELVAGVPAFHAATVADTLARIAGDYAPPPLGALVPEASERVAALAALCLSKEPALRPASVTVLLEELEAIAPEAPLVLDAGVEVARTAPPVGDTATASASVASKRGEALRAPKSPRALIGAIAAAIAAIGVGAATSLPRSPASPPAPPAVAQATAREALSVEAPPEPAPAPSPAASPAASAAIPRARSAPVRAARVRNAPDAGASPYDALDLERRN